MPPLLLLYSEWESSQQGPSQRNEHTAHLAFFPHHVSPGPKATSCHRLMRFISGAINQTSSTARHNFSHAQCPGGIINAPHLEAIEGPHQDSCVVFLKNFNVTTLRQSRVNYLMQELAHRKTYS